MTIEVKKGSFEIKGNPLELLYLNQCLANFKPCFACVTCDEKVEKVIRPIAQASFYSTTINFEELATEAQRINDDQSKKYGKEG